MFAYVVNFLYLILEKIQLPCKSFKNEHKYPSLSIYDFLQFYAKNYKQIEKIQVFDSINVNNDYIL